MFRCMPPTLSTALSRAAIRNGASGFWKGGAAMASSEEYLEYVLGLLRDVPSVSYRKMMGEFLLYSEGVLFGGIYDDRFLLKETSAACRAFSSAEIPYEGAKPMLLVDIEDPVKIAEVVGAMLPEVQSRKSKERCCRSD